MRLYSLTLSVLGAGLALSQSPPDKAFPIVGGSVGQMMRIMVAADGSVRCRVEAGSRNGEGSPPEPDKFFDLLPGQTAFMDLNLARLAGRPGQRTELRPVARVLDGKCSASVEIFEPFAGRSMDHMTLFTGLAAPVAAIPPAGPPPAFAPLSLVQGEALRLGSTVAFDPQPEPPVKCTAVLAFADARGNPVGPSRRVDLAPGRFDFVDVSASLLLPRGAPVGTRVLVQPRVLIPVGGGDLRGCRASVQVYDLFSGWTKTIIPGPCWECF
jgi:hypothetical protein